MKLRIVAGLLAVLTLTGCSDSTYDERMDYLRKVAQRGADTHALIASQEANIDRARCERAFTGLDTDDEPYFDLNSERAAFSKQVKEFFVDSCVSGKPKAVPGDPVEPTPSQSPQPTTSAS